MDLVTILNSISSFLIEPQKEDRSPFAKKMAWAVTIIIGIGTLGFAQALSLLWRKLRPVVRNESHKKIDEIFKQHVCGENKAEIKINPPLPGIMLSLTPSPSPPQLLAIAKNVYENRDQLWEAAISDASKKGKNDTETVMEYFIKNVRTQFKNEKSSLSLVSTDTNALNILFQSRRLRLAIRRYAQANNLTELLNQHLKYIAENIYNKRNDYTKEAAKIVGNKLSEIIVALTCIIMDVFKREGYSLNEVVNNHPQLSQIFNNSERLQMVLRLICLKITHSTGLFSDKSDEYDPAIHHKEEALRLAKEHAQGQGFITKLDLKEIPPDDLRKVIKNMIFKCHPDRYLNVDNHIIQDLNQLNELLKHDLFELYRKKIEEIRQN